MATSTTNSGDVLEKHRHAFADDVGDMTALESHIEEVLDRQLKDGHHADASTASATRKAVGRSWESR